MPLLSGTLLKIFLLDRRIKKNGKEKKKKGLRKRFY